MSNYQTKIKHVEGMFLREITLNFIVIGQRHCGRVTVIPSRGKKVPDGVDMLAFYKQMLLYRHECFTGKYTTRKTDKNYIRDASGLFSIISHVSLSMT